jgi:hypothetical protein
MQLTQEALLPYQGFHGTYGVCHVRVYEEPGQLPVVIAGALDDGPGTSITNAIEMVAAAIQASIFTDGREFELIQHYPSSVGDGKPIFSRLRFKHRSVEERPEDPSNYAGSIVVIDGDDAHVERGRPIQGDFRDPSWTEIADIEQLLGCEVRIWPAGEYTARAVAGEQGQQLRDEIAAQTTAATRRIIDAIEPGE